MFITINFNGDKNRNCLNCGQLWHCWNLYGSLHCRTYQSQSLVVRRFCAIHALPYLFTWFPDFRASAYVKSGFLNHFYLTQLFLSHSHQISLEQEYYFSALFQLFLSFHQCKILYVEVSELTSCLAQRSTNW